MKNPAGEMLESTYGENPLEFLFGGGMIVPGLENALLGLKPGEKKEIIVPPSEGYGNKDKNLVLRLHRSELPEGDYVVGKELRRVFTDGKSEIFRITGFIDDWVFLDGNHPLAGMELHYEVKILDVRPDTHSWISRK